MEPSERHLINPKTNPWLNLNTLNPSSLILKQYLSEQKSQYDSGQHNSGTSRSAHEPKYELNIRPYNSQIEFTKSNLFAYLKLNFDLTRNYYNANSKQNSGGKQHLTNSGNNNCLRIVLDSIDGHSIVLENSHKILDFDLSEWTLRREIQNSPNFDIFNSTEPVLLPSPLKLKVSDTDNAENLDSKLVTVIEFKFPKGFKLKRRKKVNLIAAAAKKDSSNNALAQNVTTNINSQNSFSCNSLNELGSKKKFMKKSLSNSSLVANNMTTANTANTNNTSITLNKCACCSCKMLTTRQGDIDVFEAKEVANWGTGLLVVTKFINSKNITKLINYKCLKHIWVNNNYNKSNLKNESDQFSSLS